MTSKDKLYRTLKTKEIVVKTQKERIRKTIKSKIILNNINMTKTKGMNI